MTTVEQKPTEPDALSSRPFGAGQILRYFLLAYTFLIVLGVVVSGSIAESLHDNYGVGLDVIQVACFAAVASVLLLWSLWILIFSRWNWIYRIITCVLFFGLPFLTLKIVRPVFGGDANVIRWEPIWAAVPVTPSSDAKPESKVAALEVQTTADFPRFLGPDANGIVPDAVEIDEGRFDQTKVLWRQPIGLGWSAFSIQSGYAFTMEQRDVYECVTCYSLSSGELCWIYKHEARHSDSMGLGRTGPRSTPTIHDGKVYAIGAVGNLICLDESDGAVIWQIDLQKQLGSVLTAAKDRYGFACEFEDSLSWGRAGSPLIHEGKVIVPGGGPKEGDKQTLLAFDAESGELLWSGGKEMIAYGSPSVATLSGIEQILMTAENSVMGFNPDNGDVLWKLNRLGDSTGAANTSEVSVVSDSQVLTSKGYPDGGGELIEIANEDGKLKATSVWKNRLILKTKLTSPIVYEGHSYSLSNGFLECARLIDGKRIWKRRGRFGHGQMLLMRDKLILNTEGGELLLIKASPDGFEQLGKFDKTVSGTCWNNLAVSGDRLLVRSELEAACLQLPTR